MKVSSKGLELIKDFEGFSSVAYLCSAKKATIGYGNTFWEDGTPVKIGDQISKERAETLLKHVVDNFSVAVEVDIKIVYNKASSSKRPEKFIFKSVVTDSKGNIEIIKKSFYN